MKCIVCFESGDGTGNDYDYFVSTKNGHVFHHRCAIKLVANGTPLCPVCDENLDSHPFVRLHPRSKTPPVPPRPTARSISGSSSPGSINMVRNYANPVPSGSMNKSHSRLLVGGTPASPSQTASYLVEPDATFKIVILGDLNVGKSSLLQRYADERFDPLIPCTTGCDLRVKVVRVGGKLVRLNLWDTAGQERHRALVDMYLRRADGIIFCFDITDMASFFSLQTWYDFAQARVAYETTKIIVGNKSDLWSQRVVRSEQIMNLAEQWNAQYVYTSAKDATNVEAVFRSLAALILEKVLPSEMIYSTVPSAPPMPNAQQQQVFSQRKAAGIIKLSPALKKKEKKKKDDCCNL